jgi:uncharacterized domain HDIG
MINIEKAKEEFEKYLEKYNNKSDLGFELKLVHTYHVVENAVEIAKNLNLSEEDTALAELIALLHDIGRFEEINVFKRFDSVGFDHAEYGIKLLFENNLIRDFIEDNSYDEIIKIAIRNHNKLAIQNGLDKKCLLHSKIIRDADKLDNFRVKKEEKIEAIFPGKVKNKKEMENSTLTEKVYKTVKNEKCVNIIDRITVLDYWVCVLAFIFDLNFKETHQIVKENDYINILVDKFKYKEIDTINKMEDIKKILNDYIDKRLT